MTKNEYKESHRYLRTYPYAKSECVQDQLTEKQREVLRNMEARPDFLAAKSPANYLDDLRTRVYLEQFYV